MANTVKRGAGRAAAAERSNRHAQRTPLPPRAGQVEAAKAVVDSLTPVAATDAKSQSKAQAFSELAVAAKWSVVLAPRGDVLELTATRGPETIVQGWRNGVWQYEVSVYAFQDRTTKPRNASGASKLLARSPEEAQAETNKVASNQSFRKREPKELTTIVLPLDPDVLTDEEATKYFRGRTVRWYNRWTRGAETATVSRNYPVRVTRHGKEVTISFCCPVTGFRAFHLSAVLAVGQGHRSNTPGQEHVSVELETVDAA